MRGLFVTATDTGVGKTVLSAALLAAMAGAGEDVRAYKPVVTGLDDPAEIAARGAWPADHELLASLTGQAPKEVSPLRFGPAASPHLAAELAGTTIDPAEIAAAARERADGATLVVEGVGGLLVPLTRSYAVRDLAADLGMPVVIAARCGLGTINHTLLTLAAAREAELDVRAVVLTPWPARPTAVELDNRETIAQIGRVDVHALEHVSGLGREKLARAGGALPWREWIAGYELSAAVTGSVRLAGSGPAASRARR